jgi:N-carbamoyl-L-amino-acid hydrolase
MEMSLAAVLRTRRAIDPPGARTSAPGGRTDGESVDGDAGASQIAFDVRDRRRTLVPNLIAQSAARYDRFVFDESVRREGALDFLNNSNLRINGARLWDSLMTMARIGATPKGGVKRLALTDLDREGRDLFADWCRAAGMTVSVDGVGNMFARRAGRQDELPPVVSGSHLDSQPSGGKFDGVYGVLAALEVVRTLNDCGIETTAPIEVAVWTNEEGTRFLPTMAGSGAFAGVHTVEHMLAQKDVDGVEAGAALESIGYRGALPVGGRKLAAYFEAHIEQGPVLEDEDKTIGVVTGAFGQRWYNVVVVGMDAHAGPTPMHLRRDALLATGMLVQSVNRIGRSTADARGTVGHVQVKPNSRNVIPGEVMFTVDLRATTNDRLEGMEQALRAEVARVARECNVEIDLQRAIEFAPSEFDAACVDAVRSSAQALGYTWRDIVSGAAHDAVYLSRVAPTAMIFVPCEGGISHNEIENARPEHLEAGTNVLLGAMVQAANAAGSR